MKKQNKTIARAVAEEATGIPQNPSGIGAYFADEFTKLTPQQAYDHMRQEGKQVEVPNAGAGSAKEFFTSCGFTEVRDWQTGSSAGDWVFAVKDGKEGDWYPAFQNNRYPYHGFAYSVDFSKGCDNWEQFCQVNGGD